MEVIMKYIDGSQSLCESVYRIYAYDSEKDGWWFLGFLGDHKTKAEAEEAITKYLQQPENQSGDIEVYQVRLNMTSNTLSSIVVWNPNGTIERRTP
jgi:hypothetical protein